MTIPDDYMRPEMMAIGDSLYQGVRSLTIKRGLNQLSAPAQAAEALGIRGRFSCPDPDRPVLIDMERWLKLVPDLKKIKKDLGKSADYWFSRPKSPSGRLLFENVAVASTVIADLTEQTWRTADDYLKALPAGAKGKIKKLKFDGLDLAMIVQSLNARFTLNPSGREAFKDLSQVGLVAARMPKRLLVNIGSNNGLWKVCFDAKTGRMSYKAEIKRLAQALNALPPEVEQIYFNNLALPRTVPNLMPLPSKCEWQEGKKPGAGKYYAHYENRFGIGYGRLTGRQLAKLDDHVRAVNADIRKILMDAFDNKQRLHIVDMEDLLLGFDAKHQKRTAKNVLRLKNKKTLTNVTIEAGLTGSFRRGGFMGLDGMHPTVPGYGVMAQRVLDTIAAAEPSVRPRKIDLDRAFEQDKLLGDMPNIWSVGLWLWRDIRRATDKGEKKHDLDDQEESLRAVMDTAARSMGGR